MANYRVCPICGANLDPQEKCDCMNNEHSSSAYTSRAATTAERKRPHLPASTMRPQSKSNFNISRKVSYGNKDYYQF